MGAGHVREAIRAKPWRALAPLHSAADARGERPSGRSVQSLDLGPPPPPLPPDGAVLPAFCCLNLLAHTCLCPPAFQCSTHFAPNSPLRRGSRRELVKPEYVGRRVRRLELPPPNLAVGHRHLRRHEREARAEAEGLERY